MEQRNLKKISHLILEWCVNNLGKPNKKHDPLILTVSNISNFEKHGLSEEKGVYDPIDTEITIYRYNLSSIEDLVKTVIHEYTHFLQMPNSRYCRMYDKYDDEHGYWDNPLEVEARNNENKYYVECMEFLKIKN
jgi:hypothetical protein